LKICFSCPILEGYGQSEGTAANFLQESDDPNVGHVGGIGPNVEYKLVDVPELNYFHDDQKDGIITPRGEICIRGYAVFKGYYKD